MPRYLGQQGRNIFPIRFVPHARKTRESWTRARGEWWLQRDSNPCFSLERVVTRTVSTRTYGAVATGGCHGVFKFEWFVTQPVQTLSPAGLEGTYNHAFSKNWTS